jgi:hypothetical protein
MENYFYFKTSGDFHRLFFFSCPSCRPINSKSVHVFSFNLFWLDRESITEGLEVLGGDFHVAKVFFNRCFDFTVKTFLLAKADMQGVKAKD